MGCPYWSNAQARVVAALTNTDVSPGAPDGSRRTLFPVPIEPFGGGSDLILPPVEAPVPDQRQGVNRGLAPVHGKCRVADDAGDRPAGPPPAPGVEAPHIAR